MKIGYPWPHANPRRNDKVTKNKVHDGNNETMKMGGKITLVLFHEPCRKNENEMTKWMNDTWYLMYNDPEDLRLIKTWKI